MANYVLLERIELSSDAASVTFANIPQSGYTDLKIVLAARCSSGNTAAAIRFNGDTANNYSSKRLGADSTAAYSESTSGITQLQWLIIPFTSATANTFGNAEMYVSNYLSTSAAKSILFDSVSENNSTSKDAANMEMNVGLWSKTPEAITSITILSGGGNLVAGSSVSLYGIAASGTTPAIAPFASGGNITTDGTYWIHTFNSTGTFTPTRNITCDYLIVAGGGGGGSSNSVGSRGAGGGGAGGYRHFTSQSLSANTSYTATVGAGGASNTQGVSSSFNSLSSTGGGRGGTSDVGGANSGGSGGSGGGAGQHPGTRNGGAGNAGGYTPVEGYAGTAITTDASPYGGAPGGGSSGTASYTNPPTTPTNGTANSISGSSVTYAVGGRGGVGDAEGAAATPGGANTGTGGQGGPGKSAPYQNSPGGAGGSGVVIIRYAM